MCMSVCLHVCHVYAWSLRDQKRVLGLLELKLQIGDSIWMLKAKSRFSVRGSRALRHWTISPTYFLLMFMFVSLCICAFYVYRSLMRPEEGIWFPGTGVKKGCEPSCVCWELNLGHLEDFQPRSCLSSPCFCWLLTLGWWKAVLCGPQEYMFEIAAS